MNLALSANFYTEPVTNKKILRRSLEVIMRLNALLPRSHEIIPDPKQK